MKIQNNNHCNVNSKGKFIFAKNLAQKEIELVNKINNTVVNKTTNIKILRKKPYDIFVNQSKEKPDSLELTTYYKNIWTDKKTDCYISTIDKNKSDTKSTISFFRSSLNWFDDYKKKNNGYNNFLELVVAQAKEFFINSY